MFAPSFFGLCDIDHPGQHYRWEIEKTCGAEAPVSGQAESSRPRRRPRAPER